MALRPRSPRPLCATALAAALGLIAAVPLSARAEPEGAGGKGAQIYCFMRANGNNHEVSWSAAYALIKRQSASLFRTSPEHAAVMITEAVVRNPGTYPDCGRWLGDLYARQLPAASTGSGAGAATASPSSSESGIPNRVDRYGN